jgi:apolipoprotein N-acyltransferase
LIPVNIASKNQIALALIQGGQTEKMDNTFENSEGAISRHFNAMSTVKPNTVDLVIWPENAIMHDPLVRRSTREALLSESQRISAPILVNGNLADGTNGSVLVGDGENQSYSKRYLTPFGEFIPFQSLVSKITDKASKVIPYIAGTDPYLFKSDKVKFRTLICYELLSDKQARTEMSDTDFIVTQTNNATYFKTWQLDQELSLAQARSAETHRQTAYVSTTGGTSLIDEKGGIVGELPQYENGALIGSVKTFTGSTPAVSYGSYLEIGLLVLWFALAIRALQRRFKKA